MRSITSLLVLVSVLSFAPAVTAQSPADGAAVSEPSNLTLVKLVTVRNLRCDALKRGKAARLRADIHRAELTGTLGPGKINVESQVAQAEAESGAAFEESGGLKRRLAKMMERYISDNRLQWYQSPDEAERIHLENRINGAKEIIDEPCG